MAREMKKRRKSEDRPEPRSRRRRQEEPEDDYGPDEEEFDEEDDEEEFGRPRGRGKASRGKASRRRVDDDEEDEEDEEDEDEEDERPARRSKTRKKGRASSRRRDDDEDEDDEQDAAPTIAKGWAGYQKRKQEANTFAEEFRPSEEPSLLKFLDSEPMAVYMEHWVENPPAPIRKKSYTCIGERCPLCDIGDVPSPRVVFNVVVLEEDEDPVVKVWIARTQVASQLEEFDSDKRKGGPLPRNYWAVDRMKTKQGSYVTTITPVKERDMEEEWNIEPLTEEEIASCEEAMYSETDVVQVTSRADLKSLARALEDRDRD